MNGKNCHEITYFDLKKDNSLRNQNCTSPEYFCYTPCCTVDCGITKYQVTEKNYFALFSVIGLLYCGLFPYIIKGGEVKIVICYAGVIKL